MVHEVHVCNRSIGLRKRSCVVALNCFPVLQTSQFFPSLIYCVNEEVRTATIPNISLPNFVTYLLCFLTAYEMTSRPSVLA